jgi:hypothetical protein
MTKKFETLPGPSENRETPSATTLYGTLDSLVTADAAADRKELDTCAQNRAHAAALAKDHPVYAAFLVLHGTRLMDTLRTKTARNWAMLKTYPALTESVSIGKGVEALRRELGASQRSERTQAGPDEKGVDANMLLFRTIATGPLTSPGSKSLDALSPDAVMSLRYATMALTKTAEFRMREFLDRALLPVAEVAGNTYKNYSPNDPALVRAADVVNVLNRSQRAWMAANKDAAFEKQFGDTFGLNQSVWNATQTIRDRDKPHTPVGKHFIRELLSEE